MGESMLFILIFNTTLCAGAILIHYETLCQLTNWIPRIPVKHRLRILIGLFGAFAAHIIEIWLFAFGYYFMLKVGNFGVLEGNFHSSLLDCSYFSFTTYTSLGFGDIHPIGNIRYLTGLETLVGMVMISWTASYMFIEMQKFWLDSSDKASN